MSWLDVSPERALGRIQAAVRNVVSDMQASGEAVPMPPLT